MDWIYSIFQHCIVLSTTVISIVFDNLVKDIRINTKDLISLPEFLYQRSDKYFSGKMMETWEKVFILCSYFSLNVKWYAKATIEIFFTHKNPEVKYICD